MIALGWDPGFAAGALGYGVVELSPTRSRSIAHGTLGSLGSDETAADRLDELAFAIDGIMNTHCPDVVGYEDQTGVVVGMERAGQRAGWALRRIHEVTGMLRMAARCALSDSIPLYTPQPRTIRLAVLGKGHGKPGKAGVQWAVQRLFGVQTNSHACDAIACAVAAARMHRIATAQRRASGSVIT